MNVRGLVIAEVPITGYTSIMRFVSVSMYSAILNLVIDWVLSLPNDHCFVTAAGCM